MILNAENCLLSSLTEKLEKSIPQLSLIAAGKSTNIESLTEFGAPDILCNVQVEVTKVLAKWLWLKPELFYSVWQGSFTSVAILN